MAKQDTTDNNNKTNKFGIFMALAFYILSVVMVAINTSDDGVVDGGVKTITIAHWQLEDGFREGFDEAIKMYEKQKAEQGEKIKVIQTTVPFRGYPQWFVTQLISGDPADIIELTGSSQLHNQYFEPLANYISKPNPYNQGTPLAGVPWKDTYIDGMKTGFNPIYADYFGVGMFFHVLRVYVNKSLLKAATGSDKMPRTFDEWMEDCRKLKEYGKKTGKPIIPIGVRGFDKVTLHNLFRRYFSQLNGHLNDKGLTFCLRNASAYQLLKLISEGKVNKDRLLAAVDLTKEFGQKFSEGFSATDLEQTKYLFFTGNVGFFPEGTHNAWSMVNNSPFEVDVINIPVIGPSNRFYKNFTGQTSELGVGVGGRFGIPKASENFDLALDFLQFLTSYKINQMTMMDYCKWPPAVVKANYKGLLKKFEPVEGDARRPVIVPFYLDKKSKSKMLETLEYIIINDVAEPQKYFWKEFIANILILKEEIQEGMNGKERQFFDVEGQRSGIGMGLLSGELSAKMKQIYKTRYAMRLGSLVDNMNQQYASTVCLKALDRIEKNETENKDNSPQEVR